MKKYCISLDNSYFGLKRVKFIFKFCSHGDKAVQDAYYNLMTLF